MLGRTEPGGAWSEGDGRVSMEEPASGVLVFRMTGRMTASFVPKFEAAAAQYAQQGKQVDFFFDTERMTGYQPEFREQMTAWHASSKPYTRSASVLVKSKLVSMAIAVANLATGGMLKTFSDPAAFEAAIQAAVRRAQT